MMNLSRDCKFVYGLGQVAAGQVTQNTSIVDMSQAANVGGFDAVCALLSLGTVTAGSVITLSIQDSATNNGGAMAAIAANYSAVVNGTGGAVAQSSTNCGIQLTDTGGATSNEILICDVVLPQLRYVRAQITIGTANAAINACLLILYRSKERAVALDTATAGVGFFTANG